MLKKSRRMKGNPIMRKKEQKDERGLRWKPGWCMTDLAAFVTNQNLKGRVDG